MINSLINQVGLQYIVQITQFVKYELIKQLTTQLNGLYRAGVMN